MCVFFFLSAVLSDNQKTIKLIAKVYPIYTLNVRLEVFSYYLIVFPLKVRGLGHIIQVCFKKDKWSK